ncbi:hypothetical protein Ql52_gp024 [Caulobacter phage Quill_5.2]|uniref:dATP/dGTP diphosphohydrolase N-terminal domain-containing protein n=1 Tax=Caulobacter phage Quill_5.2 TaxID=3075108 RepID=A0AA96Q0Z1_9CAUD|nr:hypothetical protein Ql52_gp024 [Caulobacter phage Quill_5.2]
MSDKYKPNEAGNSEAKVGLRFNNGKRRFDLIPPDGLAALADLFTIGSRKYAERNWELGMKYSNVFASLERHYQAWKSGEDRDEETGQLHMVHVCWNAMVLAVYQLRGVGEDDRVKVKMPEPV